MSSWREEFLPEATRSFSRLDKSTRLHVVARVQWLVENFENTKHIQFQDDLKGLFKLRVGDWRVAYTFELPNKRVIIHAIGHRSKVYRKRR